MSVTDDNNGQCFPTDDLVSYLYHEMTGPESTRFEQHLSGCDACTDQFAAVCDSRYSVYEWHREEFEPLETPVFDNPALSADAETSGTGIFAGLLGLIPSVRLPVYSAAFAAIAVAVVYGAYLLYFAVPVGDTPVAAVPVNNEMEIASNVSRTEITVAPDADDKLAAKSGDTESVDAKGASDEETVAKTASRTGRTGLTPVKNVIRQRPPEPHNDTGRIRGSNAAQTASKPVLSDFDMPVDESPRLTDLFDQIGSES